MNGNLRVSRLGWVGAAVLMLAGTPGFAANAQDMVRDTQRMDNANGTMSMVWWIPQQYWEESMKSNPAMPQDVREQMLTVLDDCLLVAVMSAKMGPRGLTDTVPKAELVANAKLTLDGKVIEPVDPAKLSQAAQLLLSQLKPGMTAAMGQLGQGVEFIVYPRFDPMQPGSLQISLFDRTHSWRLPLGSLLPERTDGKTGEKFPGNYEFNPYTGAKLAK